MKDIKKSLFAVQNDVKKKSCKVKKKKNGHGASVVHMKIEK